MSNQASSYVSYLECSACEDKFPAGTVQNLCHCGAPLWVRYDLKRLAGAWSKKDFKNGPNSMWRYAPALPVSRQECIITLGEGMTPLLPLRRLGSHLGASNLWIKDEGLNPTGSFKARGMSCAISMAVELGIKR